MWVGWTTCPRTYYRGAPGVCRIYYYYNTIRVGIHIACICEEEGVGQFITRTRFYTLGLYILIFN
jgi:hypothetical protein